jgi:hypothetical protein
MKKIIWLDETIQIIYKLCPLNQVNHTFKILKDQFVNL